VSSQAGKINGLSEPVRDGQVFRWVGTAAAKRWVGVLLALYAFATDWLSGWHGMNFAMRGLLDWPAHLATALVILGAVIRMRGALTDQRFGWAMLACSVLIDVDHLPEEFGSDALTNGTPRPYTHALWVVIVLTLAWATARFFVARSRRPRPAKVGLILAGAAWGVAAHFVRDIATAPMSFWWPVTDMAVEVPYWWYVVALTVIIAIGPVRRRSRSTDAWSTDNVRTAVPQTRRQTVNLPLGGDDHGGDPESAQSGYIVELLDGALVKRDRRLRHPAPLLEYRPDEADFLDGEPCVPRLPDQLTGPVVASAEPLPGQSLGQPGEEWRGELKVPSAYGRTVPLEGEPPVRADQDQVATGPQDAVYLAE
jgi:hypothetical protein